VLTLRPLRASLAEANGAEPIGAAEQWGAAAAGGLLAALLALGAIAVPQRLAVVILPAAVLIVIALAIRDLRRVLLVVALIDLPLGFDINVGYSDSVAKLGGISGFNLSLTTGCLIVLYAMWLGEVLGGGSQSRWRAPIGLCIPPLLYLASVVLSLTVARDVTLSSYELFMLLQIFLLYLYIVSTVRGDGEVLLLVAALLFGLVFESLFILAQRYLGPGFHLPGITNRIDAGIAASGLSTRLGGTLGSPNTAGSYLALLLPVALAVTIAPLARRYKLLAAVGFVLGVAALVDTLSRGGWIAFAISCGLVCLVAVQRRWLPLVIPAAVAGVLAMVMLISALPLQHAVLRRLTGNDYGSAHSRVDLAHMAENVIRDHPVFGVGANNYALVLPQYETARFSQAWHYTVHDKYLLVWAETGIVGLVAFLGFLLSTVGRGARAVRQSNRLRAILALGLTAGVVGQFAHMSVDLFHNRPQVESLWLAAALITVLWVNARREEEVA
jgi:O-antigen ligase